MQPHTLGSRDLPDRLSEAMLEIEQAISGRISFAAAALEAPDRILTRDATAHIATASVIKVPIMLTALAMAEEGRLDLRRRHPLGAEDAVGGSGVLHMFNPGLTPTVDDLLTMMIVTSDNVATNAVLDLIGGPAAVNSLLDGLHLNGIRLHNRVDFDIIADDPRAFGVATTEQLHRLIQGIAQRVVVSPWVSQRAEGVLSKQIFLDQVPRHYLVNPYGSTVAPPASLSVASKTGFMAGIRVDAGIVRWRDGGFSYACSVDESHDLSFAACAEPQIAIGLVGRALLEHFWPETLGPTPVTCSPPGCARQV